MGAVAIKPTQAAPSSLLLGPFSVQDPQVEGAADQSPLRIDRFKPPHGPPAPVFMLFEVAENSFNNLAPLAQ